MAKLVVRIRRVRMRVPGWLVDVNVAVEAGGHRIVRVAVMPIRVIVSVLVFHPCMAVLVPVALEQMEEHAQSHQAPRSRHKPAA